MARPQCDTPPLVEQVFTLALIQIQFFHPFGRVGFVCASLGRCVCVCVCLCVFVYLFGFVVLARGREGGSHGGVGDGNERSVGVVPIPFASAACAHADGNIWDLVGRRRRHGTVRQSAHGEAFRRQRQLYYNHCMCAQSLCLCVCLSLRLCVSHLLSKSEPLLPIAQLLVLSSIRGFKP
jgi:hypothetical protein